MIFQREFIGTAELAARLGVSDATLRQWKYLKKGIEPCKIGGRLKYRLSDVIKFEKENQINFKKGKKNDKKNGEKEIKKKAKQSVN